MFRLSNYTLKEKSYILYDVANSAFILTIVTVLFPLYYQTVAANVENRTQIFAFVTSGIALTIAIMSPIVGALANYRGNKKKFFVLFFVIGLVGGFGLILPGLSWVTLLTIFVITEIGYGMSNVIYDAFLVDVADEDRLDVVSSAGYGWGYIGSMVPFMIGIIPYALVTLGFLDASYEYLSIVFAFTLSLGWWGFYTIPLLKNVSQTYESKASKKPIRDAFKSIYTTFRDIRSYKYIVLFMVAYLLYIDVVNTVIRLATTLGTELGVGVTTLLGVVIMVQLIGFPSAIIYGKLTKRFGGKNMIYVGIGVYALTIVLTAMINEDRTYLMWVIGFLVGTAQGGIQSISRSYFAKMLPIEKANEFFGFFSVFGKFAGILSPFLIGLVIASWGPNAAVMMLILPLSIGAIILFFVKPEIQEKLLEQ